MPTYPPRANSTKKREQLQKRRQELQHVLRAGASHEQLVAAAEKLRLAQLSLLKADLMWMRESRLRNFRVSELSSAAQKCISHIEEQTRKWEATTVDEILQDVEIEAKACEFL